MLTLDVHAGKRPLSQGQTVPPLVPSARAKRQRTHAGNSAAAAAPQPGTLTLQQLLLAAWRQQSAHERLAALQHVGSYATPQRTQQQQQETCPHAPALPAHSSALSSSGRKSSGLPQTSCPPLPSAASCSLLPALPGLTIPERPAPLRSANSLALLLLQQKQASAAKAGQAWQGPGSEDRIPAVWGSSGAAGALRCLAHCVAVSLTGQLCTILCAAWLAGQLYCPAARPG